MSLLAFAQIPDKLSIASWIVAARRAWSRPRLQSLLLPRTTGTSLNEAAVDALVEGSGVAGGRRKRRDLGDIARTWRADKAVAAALADQDRVDEDLWR